MMTNLRFIDPLLITPGGAPDNPHICELGLVKLSYYVPAVASSSSCDRRLWAFLSFLANCRTLVLNICTQLVVSCSEFSGYRILKSCAICSTGTKKEMLISTTIFLELWPATA